jgi:hypothetical protein
MVSEARYGRRRLGLALVLMASVAGVVVGAGAQVWALPFVLGELGLFGAGVELMLR